VLLGSLGMMLHSVHQGAWGAAGVLLRAAMVLKLLHFLRYLAYMLQLWGLLLLCAWPLGMRVGWEVAELWACDRVGAR
jgi:hypothetical protein